MIDIDAIRPYLDIWHEKTAKVLAMCANVRDTRSPLHLFKDEYIEVLRWKLGGSWRFSKRTHLAIDEGVVIRATGDAFACDSERVAIEILDALPGVGIPVASALLTAMIPERYAVVDRRVWRQLYDEDQPRLTSDLYAGYLADIRDLASELNVTPQQVDVALFWRDKDKGNKL